MEKTFECPPPGTGLMDTQRTEKPFPSSPHGHKAPFKAAFIIIQKMAPKWSSKLKLQGVWRVIVSCLIACGAAITTQYSMNLKTHTYIFQVYPGALYQMLICIGTYLPGSQWRTTTQSQFFFPISFFFAPDCLIFCIIIVIFKSRGF